MRRIFHFSALARTAATMTGHPLTFFSALLLIVTWAASGPLFHFSDTWQLVVNTATTIVTFLMVFLIQNSQNRDTIALHLKLDELIRAIKEARNSLIDLENLEDQELRQLLANYRKLAVDEPMADPQLTADAPPSRNTR